MIGKAPLLILVGALLNATLIFPLVGNLREISRTEAVGNVPRWVVPLVAGLLFALLLPLERALLRGSPPDRHQRSFVPFIVGASLALSLPTVALGLNFVGLPLLDLYLACAFSFILLLYWAWRYRALFAGPIPSQISQAYSVVLVLLAAWHLLSLGVRFVARGVAAATHAQAAVSWYTGVLFAILAISCLLVVHLRRQRSPYALPGTTALSVWLAIDLPFGTAAFLYWLLRVRRYEVVEPAAQQGHEADVE